MPDITTRYYEGNFNSDTAGTVSVLDISTSDKGMVWAGHWGLSNAVGWGRWPNGVAPPTRMFIHNLLSDVFWNTTNNVTVSKPVMDNTFYSFGVMKYVGAASGDNEFITRAHVPLNLSNGSQTAFSTTVSGVDIAKCVPFAQGGRGSDMTLNMSAQQMKIDLVSTAANHVQVRGIRGRISASVQVTVALVEFTGANWDVISGSKSGSVAGSTDVISISSVGNWDEAFIYATHRMPAAQNGSNDTGFLVGPGSTATTMGLRFLSGISSVSDHAVQFYIIQNPQLDVRHRGTLSGDLSLSAEAVSQDAQSIAVSVTAVASLSAMVPVLYTASNDAAPNYPNNCWVAVPRTTNQIVLSRGRSDVNAEWQLAVVDFADVSGTATAGPSYNITGAIGF